MKNKPVTLFAILLTISGLFIFFIPVFNNLSSEYKTSYFSKKIIEKCSNDNFRRVCYDREIPKLLKKGFVTMEEAFLITNDIQKKDTSYLYCHTLGHELADIETAKNTDKWLDVMARCPNSACNGGCEHGAVVRKFKGSETLTDAQIKAIIPEISTACEPRGSWRPSGLEISLCYHSMGHLGMYITNADIERSLDFCKDVSKKPDGRDYYQTCVQGVFMIIFQARDSDDLALVSRIAPKKVEIESFCSKYSGIDMVACRIESWPLFSEELRSAEGLTKFCSFTNDSNFRKWCFDDSGMRGGLSIEILQSKGISGVADYCVSFPSDIRERCFSSVATAWIQDEPSFLSKSIELCQAGSKYGYSSKCFDALASYSVFRLNKGSREWSDYCTALPSFYKEKCLKGEVSDSW